MQAVSETSDICTLMCIHLLKYHWKRQILAEVLHVSESQITRCLRTGISSLAIRQGFMQLLSNKPQIIPDDKVLFRLCNKFCNLLSNEEGVEFVGGDLSEGAYNYSDNTVEHRNRICGMLAQRFSSIYGNNMDFLSDPKREFLSPPGTKPQNWWQTFRSKINNVQQYDNSQQSPCGSVRLLWPLVKSSNMASSARLLNSNVSAKELLLDSLIPGVIGGFSENRAEDIISNIHITHSFSSYCQFLSDMFFLHKDNLDTKKEKNVEKSAVSWPTHVPRFFSSNYSRMEQLESIPLSSTSFKLDSDYGPENFSSHYVKELGEGTVCESYLESLIMELEEYQVSVEQVFSQNVKQKSSDFLELIETYEALENEANQALSQVQIILTLLKENDFEIMSDFFRIALNFRRKKNLSFLLYLLTLIEWSFLSLNKIEKDISADINSLNSFLNHIDLLTSIRECLTDISFINITRFRLSWLDDLFFDGESNKLSLPKLKDLESSKLLESQSANSLSIISSLMNREKICSKLIFRYFREMISQYFFYSFSTGILSVSELNHENLAREEVVNIFSEMSLLLLIKVAWRLKNEVNLMKHLESGLRNELWGIFRQNFIDYFLKHSTLLTPSSADRLLSLAPHYNVKDKERSNLLEYVSSITDTHFISLLTEILNSFASFAQFFSTRLSRFYKVQSGLVSVINSSNKYSDDDLLNCQELWYLFCKQTDHFISELLKIRADSARILHFTDVKHLIARIDELLAKVHSILNSQKDVAFSTVNEPFLVYQVDSCNSTPNNQIFFPQTHNAITNLSIVFLRQEYNRLFAKIEAVLELERWEIFGNITEEHQKFVLALTSSPSKPDYDNKNKLNNSDDILIQHETDDHVAFHSPLAQRKQKSSLNHGSPVGQKKLIVPFTTDNEGFSVPNSTIVLLEELFYFREFIDTLPLPTNFAITCIQRLLIQYGELSLSMLVEGKSIELGVVTHLSQLNLALGSQALACWCAIVKRIPNIFSSSRLLNLNQAEVNKCFSKLYCKLKEHRLAIDSKIVYIFQCDTENLSFHGLQWSEGGVEWISQILKKIGRLERCLQSVMKLSDRAVVVIPFISLQVRRIKIVLSQVSPGLIRFQDDNIIALTLSSFVAEIRKLGYNIVDAILRRDDIQSPSDVISIYESGNGSIFFENPRKKAGLSVSPVNVLSLFLNRST